MGILTAQHRMGAAAVIMGASIMLSRFMGLLRDKVISWQFGASGEADMYFAAFVVPDIINYLLAGGYVSITLIPLLASRFQEDAQDAWRFFSCVFWWALAASVLLTGLAAVWAAPLAAWVAPGFSEAQTARLASFLRIILPAQVFFLGGACFSALLFLRRQFTVPALTPLIYNGAIILGGLLLPVPGMEGFCWGVTAGAALGAFILPWLAARQDGLHVSWQWRHPLMGRFLLIALPLMLGQSVVMLNEQFLRVFGSLAGDGAVSLLSYARRIAQVPVGMVGQAAAVASYPFLAALAARGEAETFDSTLNAALKSSLALLIPCVMWMLAAALPTMCFIFQGGQFNAADTLASVPLLQLMLLMTPFWTAQMIIGRAFYAHGDTLTPALAGTAVTMASIPVFIFWAAPAGAPAIAAVSSLGVLVYALLLAEIWRRRHGSAAFAGIVRQSCQCLLLCLPATAAAWWAGERCMEALPLAPAFAALVALACGGLVFALCYALPAWKLAPELLAPLLSRLRRGAAS
ncbi:MAG: murein biosynthesis integral membrane protein MurJ [Desulfovibrionaceae bacterium]